MHQRHRPRLPPPRPRRRHRGRRLPASGSSASRSSRTPPDQMFEGIDLLDPTKFVPEELAPVQPIGLMTLNANPANFFAETEQVAFHPGHLVPGIDVTDDPLLQVRLFSYIDTQITRLGGPNFGQLPINRPHAPVNDMLRDGMHQTRRPRAASRPTGRIRSTAAAPSLPGRRRGVRRRAGTSSPQRSRSAKSPASFDDHFSQARLFFRSLTPVEQDHVIQAYTFELGKCYEQAIRERQLLALANIDAGLCARWPPGLGLPAPAATVTSRTRRRARPCPRSAVPGPSPAGSSASSRTRPATWTGAGGPDSAGRRRDRAAGDRPGRGHARREQRSRFRCSAPTSRHARPSSTPC